MVASANPRERQLSNDGASRRFPWLGANLVALAALPFLLGMAPPWQTSGAGRGDTGSHDFADPFVLRDGDTYYGYATGSGGANLQVAKSRDLATWTLRGEALPKVASWAAPEPGYTWAPSVLPRRGRYVLYYTARQKASGFQCISRAVSGTPAGPYVDDSSAPLVCDLGRDAGACGSIDPSPFVDADGEAYLYWKSDENSPACHAPPHIWSQRLSDDGLVLTGERAKLLAMDRPWEAPIVEGPSMVRNGSAYFLFYSANWYDGADYAIGYATCAGPAGPCTKATTEAPLVESRGEMLGPGGQEFFADAGGRTWMAYHAWTAPRAGYTSGGVRSLRVAPVSFDGGAPRIDLGGVVTAEMDRGAGDPARSVALEPSQGPGGRLGLTEPSDRKAAPSRAE